MPDLKQSLETASSMGRGPRSASGEKLGERKTSNAAG